MASERDRYVLKGGKPGYDRLQKLSRIRWPDTERFLQGTGLRPGFRCVDVGCGAGTVSLEIARRVAPGGTVLGIDMDPVELSLAEEAARHRGLDNVTFRAQTAQAWDERSTYDLAYSRFLLQHLTDPVDLLRRMWRALVPGGWLAVEDVDWEGWGSEPPSGAVRFLVERYGETLRRRGGNPRVGLALYRHFRDLGAEAPEVTLLEELRLDPESRGMAAGTLESAAEAIVREGVARPEEIRGAVEALRALGEDPDALIWGPRIFQVRARKGSPPPAQ